MRSRWVLGMRGMGRMEKMNNKGKKIECHSVQDIITTSSQKTNNTTSNSSTH